MVSHNYKFYKPDSIIKTFKIDWLLLFLVLIICIIGVGALYSAGDGNLKPWAISHIYKIILGFSIVLILSQFKINFIIHFQSFYMYFVLYVYFMLFILELERKKMDRSKISFISAIRVSKDISDTIISKIFF